TFYQLHLLFDKHAGEQDELVDMIAERIQLLGGVSIAMAADVAERTIVPRPPKGREEPPVQISRLLHAHEVLLKEARTMARQADKADDQGTNDLLVSDVIRRNELQVWFVSQHVVDVPLARAETRTRERSPERTTMSPGLASKPREEHIAGASGLKLFVRSWRPDGAVRGAVAIVPGFNSHSGYYG